MCVGTYLKELNYLAGNVSYRFTISANFRTFCIQKHHNPSISTTCEALLQLEVPKPELLESLSFACSSQSARHCIGNYSLNPAESLV
jgi:hypothetical protein